MVSSQIVQPFKQWSVRGDKTNEPGCLKRHLASLCQKYPMLELLTGDAIFAQRPLLEELKQHGRKYLFQLKENQGDAFEAVKYAFSEVGEPDDVTYSKKKDALKFANSGATSTTRSTFARSFRCENKFCTASTSACHADIFDLHKTVNLSNIGEAGDSPNKLKFC